METMVWPSGLSDGVGTKRSEARIQEGSNPPTPTPTPVLVSGSWTQCLVLRFRGKTETVLCATLRRVLVKDSDLLGTLSLSPPRVKLLTTPLSAHAVHAPRHCHFMHAHTRMSAFHARIPGSLHFTHAYPVSQHSAHAYPMLTSPCIAYWSYVGTLLRPFLMKKTGSGSVFHVIIILNGAIKTKYTAPVSYTHLTLPTMAVV